MSKGRIVTCARAASVNWWSTKLQVHLPRFGSTVDQSISNRSQRMPFDASALRSHDRFQTELAPMISEKGRGLTEDLTRGQPAGGFASLFGSDSVTPSATTEAIAQSTSTTANFRRPSLCLGSGPTTLRL
jgi:hypothetical protein